MILAIVGWWFRRHFKRKQAAAEIVLSPEELARLELEKLAQSRPGRNGRGAILRGTDGHGAALHRADHRHSRTEQTTEEFLREISRANTFNRDTNERLRNFLESADLVKFAAHRPRREDIEESFSRARIFIGLKPQEPALQPQEAAV